MDVQRRYFEEEMRYLHEAGRLFAENHPEVGRYLNVDSVTDRDPYVERLFEGFAFLSGRIHERLDDEMPEYTQALCNLLYPHYLRPIPSLTIVELKPKPGIIQQATVLPKGTELRSEPVGDDYVTCRFATTQDVRLLPLQVQDAALSWTTDGLSAVTIRLKLDRGVPYGGLDLSPLRFYFHAEAPTASAMHLFFTQHVSRVTFRSGSAEVSVPGAGAVRRVGLSPDEGVVPYGANSHTGYRLLQEYLCFRRKFWFVDMVDLEQLSAPEDATEFEIFVQFDAAYPEDKRFRADNLRLHCAPAVNLFQSDAEPIRADGFSSEYRVVPSRRHRHSMEAFEVEEVIGMEDVSGKRHAYEPFFAFGSSQASGRRYVVRRRPGAGNRPDLYISAEAGRGRDGEPPTAETLSLRLTCTNGIVPKERLREGMITQLAPEVPQIAAPTNLTPPTLILSPPIERERDFYWKVVSHWSLNYLSVATREALTGILGLYDWLGDEANRRRIAGIKEVTWMPKEVMRRGSILRGVEVTLTVQDGHFADEGDVNLFGLVLSEFLSSFATMNSFVHLAIDITPTGKRFEWKPKQGSAPVL